ncbi:Retrovirus-related Pol polyprotein from transposon TNT 1-94 [Linum grandiflorum]
MEDLKSGVTTAKGIYVIDMLSTHSTSWVFDTACGSHITTNMQGLKRSRILAKGEMDLRVGNGARVAAISVGVYSLSLPSGLVLELNNCYYVPALTKNIISGSVLDSEGYSILIGNNCCSINKNGVFYANAVLMNDLYYLDLSRSVYNINTKKQKTNSQSTYLWHCRLGHISLQRMKQLRLVGVSTSFSCESFDTCEACLMGKMTRSPFPGQGQRANDLLDLIHTDVCGPMSSMARGGFRYFITFTDDLSRYGYIYLMKHKSESFEKFKEFQNEVQNQLGRTIKAIRSDRGGEYLSQVFTNHLRSCGIISQLTPPGTPQLNGVSERRNRTLLDMVRSMMSFANLPISFWGHALITAAFTLNRTPSKSVEKTPYHIWTGKAPVISF